MVILGIDPGLAILGYGVISKNGSQLAVSDYGVLRTEPDSRMPRRLEMIYNGMKQLFSMFSPDAVAFEELFFYRNVTTAIPIASARGVALLAAAETGCPLYEYTPMQIKLAVTGYGHAKKPQVQQMIKLLLGLGEPPKPDDAADALAVAICHANMEAVMWPQFEIK